MEETAFLELIKENERQILHVCRYYSAIEWQKEFLEEKNWSIVESVSCWVIAAVLRYFLATNLRENGLWFVLASYIFLVVHGVLFVSFYPHA